MARLRNAIIKQDVVTAQLKESLEKNVTGATSLITIMAILSKTLAIVSRG